MGSKIPGRFLKAWRERHSLNQEQAAEKLSINRSDISKIEQDKQCSVTGMMLLIMQDLDLSKGYPTITLQSVLGNTAFVTQVPQAQAVTQQEHPPLTPRPVEQVETKKMTDEEEAAFIAVKNKELLEKRERLRRQREPEALRRLTAANATQLKAATK